MILSGVHIVGKKITQDIHISQEMISLVDDAKTAGHKRIVFSNVIAFPGLINSHDHLDFNLFPRIGNKIYNNYSEWADDIQEHNRAQMDAVLKVPGADRVNWGIYKNLLNGISTVVNHGQKLLIREDLINVYQEVQSLHSIRYEKNWKLKLMKPASSAIAIHIGEGTDEAGKREIDKLIKWNLLKKELIGIHAVAMTKKQATNFKALVWCPASNFFLLDNTADIAELKKSTKILFGTDSTLTAGWNIWEQLRLAKQQQALTDQELFESVTINSAKIWNINTGEIKAGKFADVVIAKAKDPSDTLNSFYLTNPEDILLVIHKGNIRLVDVSIADQVMKIYPAISSFNRISLAGVTKLIQGDINALRERIIKKYSNADFPINFDPC